MNDRQGPFLSDEILPSGWQSKVQSFLAHLVESLLFSGILLLLILVFYPQYERLHQRRELADSTQNLHNLVEALLIYTSDQPGHRAFPPSPYRVNTGIALCPILPPEPCHLAFLTTPVPYMPRLVKDPYLTRMAGDIPQTPFILHWIKTGSLSLMNREDYIHLGWGAFTVGPSLALPAAYDVSIFQWVPYDTRPLRFYYFNPSNGLVSLGFVYWDSLGNTSPG